MHLLGLIERVIAPERLSFTLGILLQQEGRSGNLIDGATTAYPDCHRSLLAVEHEFLHIKLVVGLAWSMGLRLCLRV